ncbi:MAG: Extracellular solute-binding protein family 3 [Herbaspirillum sp.]|jgi:NitT/TauT family transport system substrate-binding protein|nr:Extracellular solute-binding protein family 3 [Herbaspirillum sp.]
MIKRRLMQMLLIGCAVMASVVQAQTPGIEKPDLKVAVGSKVGLFFLPTLLADHLGYFKDEGLHVQIIDLGSGGKALEALVGGSVDVTSGAYDHTVQLQAKKIPLRAFVLEGKLADYSLGIVKGKAPNYQSPKDLKGLIIGVSSPGSGSDLFVKQVLALAGLKSSDVSLVNVGQAAGAVAAVRAGQLDAIANTDPVMSILEQAGNVRIIADGRTEAGSKIVYGGNYPTGAVYAHEDFIKKNPHTVQALTNAIVRTLRYMSHATPEQIMKALPPEFANGDQKTFLLALKTMLPTYSPDGLFPPDAGETVRNALSMIDANVRNSKIDLSQTYTNDFVKQALSQPAK